MKEVQIWKSLDFMGYPDYQVSTLGNVKSMNYLHTRKERILKPSKYKGYLYVCLSKDNKHKTFLLHRIVALAFIPQPNDKCNEINHLDENKENNHVSNLCWCTRKENINYGTRNERASKTRKGKHHTKETRKKMCEQRKGKPKYKHRKPILQYTLDDVFVKEFDSAKSASEELNIYPTSITACCKGKLKSAYGYIWKYKDVA